MPKRSKSRLFPEKFVFSIKEENTAQSALQRDHWHSDAIRTRYIWIPAGSAALHSSATPADVGASPDHVRTLSFSATLDQEAIMTFVVPDDYIPFGPSSTGDMGLTIVWSPGGTNTGLVRWQVTCTEIPAETNAATAGVPVFVLPAGPGVAAQTQYTDLGTTLVTPTAVGNFCKLNVMRTGAHASDTYTNAALLIGVIVYYTAGI